MSDERESIGKPEGRKGQEGGPEILGDDELGPNVDGLSTKQEQAIVALLSESSVPKAASAIQVGSRTLYRWLSDPRFSRAFRRTRREAFGQAVALTQRYAVLAVNVLAKMMTDPLAPPHVRVTAAVAILRLGQDGIELDDLAARVEALEATAGQERQTH
jgi:hypothetical protein